MIGDSKDEKIIFGIKIFLLIIEIIVIGIIAFIFFGVSKVNAQSIDYNNTSNYIHKKTPTQEWLNFNRATDYSLNQTASYDQVNIQWTNYQGGVANGVVVMTITGGTITTATCGELYSAFSVKENGTDTGATITRNECIVNSTSATVRIGFVTSVLGTNSYLEVQFRKEFMLATKINAYGVMTVKQIDSATNTDIQDQTNALINNNNSNTQIITNAVENSTTNIINQMQDNIQMCEIYNYENAPIGETGGFLRNTGTIQSNVAWKISEYVEIHKDTTYQLIINYNAQDPSYCIYNKNKEKISCTPMGNTGTINITPSQDGYIRYSMYNSGITQFKGRYCQDRTQAEIDELQQLRSQLMHSGEWEEEDDEVKNGLLRNIISGIGNIFSFLQDDDIDDPSSAIEDIEGDMISDTPISDLLLLPVTLYQNVLLQINGNCTSINLGQLWGEDFIITCINIQNIIGSALYGTIDILISGFFILAIRKKFIDIFENLSSLHTRRNELE